MNPAPTARRRLFVLLTVAGLWVFAEAASWLVLTLADGVSADGGVSTLSEAHRAILTRFVEGDRPSHVAHSPTLGWTASPGAQGEYRICRYGLRSEADRRPELPAGRVRIATFGDSFTFGAEVNGLLTFQEVLMRLRPDLEVLNFGVPGYGPDQAYLRFLAERPLWRPDVVVLGFMTENFNRVVNTFRPFYLPQTGLPFAKPRFLLAADGLELVPNPLPDLRDYRRLLERPGPVLERLAEHDFYARGWARPRLWGRLPTVRLVRRALRLWPGESTSALAAAAAGADHEGVEITRRLFDRFHLEAEAAGSTPVILLFPRQQDIGLYRRGQPVPYSPLIDHLEVRTYSYVDLLGALGDRPESPRELADPHFTPRAHAYAAVEILRHLQREGWVPAGEVPPGVRAELARALAASDSYSRLDPATRRWVQAQAERGLDAVL
ncbi:MAG: SGNH/GDSL hydrolase family protein [Thermoanaerobaculia bacterium]|nr:SGNH/GDSL hydrolase family protein [Thermoanaerobaculia bacterium]